MNVRTNSRIPLLGAVLGINLLLGVAQSGFAQAKVPLPVDATGDIDGAAYAIKVPGNWNGKLLVFVHGYGEVERPVPLGPADEALLSEGYAMAASAMRNSGWTVEEGLVDTRRLTEYFRAHIGRPSHTILWGASMGSVIVLKSAEKNSWLYDGFIPTCSPAAGTSRTMDYALAIGLAYDITFGWPSAWGELGNVRDDLDFGEVFSTLESQLPSGDTFGKWEFTRLVGGMPSQGFYDGSLFDTMFFATSGRAELEGRAGGPVAQNRDHHYSLTSDEIEYLDTLGVDARALLKRMNARRNIKASPKGRIYTSRYADFSGLITKPVLTIHNEHDPLVISASESVYRETVRRAGKLRNLLQVYVTGEYHCDFTDEQLLTCIHQMDKWLDSGIKPKVTDFPADLGFLPDFEPPAWPVVRRDDHHD